MSTDGLDNLLDELRTAIVVAGRISYQGPDPLVEIMLDAMELPEGVGIIVTMLEPIDPTSCPPQTIEAAMQRLWSRVLGVDLGAAGSDFPTPGGLVVDGRADAMGPIHAPI